MWKYLLLSYLFHFWQFQSYSFYMLFGSLRRSYLHSVYPDSSLTLPFIPSVSGLRDFHGSNPQFLHPLKWAASVAALFSTSLSMTLYKPEIWIFFYSWLRLGSSPHTTHLLLNFVRGGTLLSASLGCWVVEEVLLLCFQIGFHVVCLKLDSFYRLSCGGKDPFYCAVVYRPPGPNSTFLKEFSNCLSYTLKLSRLVVFGDFNVHIDDDSELFARSFMSVIDIFNLSSMCLALLTPKGTLWTSVLLWIWMLILFVLRTFLFLTTTVIFHWSVTVTQFSAPHSMRSASSAGMLSEDFNLFFSP